MTSKPGVAPPGSASGAPQSLAPHSTQRPVDRSRPSGIQESPGLAHEQPASMYLSARAETLDWERRADWLEAEARMRSDAGSRARLLLAASEVRALLGARREAQELAREAVQTAGENTTTFIAARQARSLQQVPGEVAAVIESLQTESKSARSAATRAHAQYSIAEWIRLVQRDEGQAEPWLEAAEQSDPSDVRPTLQRLARQLARDQKPPDVHFRLDDEVRGLRQAAAHLQQLRGAEVPRLSPADAGALPLLEIQRALRRGKLTEAADAVTQLEARSGLRAAARWLSLFWRESDGRAADALGEMRQLVRDTPGRLERRALAARALRAGDAQVLAEALDDAFYVSEPASAALTDTQAGIPEETRATRPVFTTLERTALAALVGEPPPMRADGSLRPADLLALKPLEAALGRLNSPPTELAAGALPVEREFAVGRDAASLRSFGELQPGPGQDAGHWSKLLELERYREAKDSSGLAEALHVLGTQPRAAAECHFVCGVFAERAGVWELARGHYQAAMLSATTREAAVRVQSSRAPDSAAMFRALSAHTSDALLRSLLLTEALFRLHIDAPEFDALAEEAGRTHPALPFAYQLAEVAARMRGDRPRVTRWLARERERARVSGDFALATIFEASFIAQSDAALAAERLEELTPEGPLDLALQHRRERWAQVSAAAKAQFRRRAAPLLGARSREYFLAEAVALHELSGDHASAVAAAREMTGPLGAIWVERLAREPRDLEQLATSWSRMARDTQDPELACDLYDRLARLELGRGERAQAVAWQRERLKLKPGSLGALRMLEIDSMLAGREAELEAVSSELVEVLAEQDGMAYAFLASRLKIDRGAFKEGRALAARATATATPPLWALRLEVAYAQSASDDRSLLGVYRTLRERANQPLDAATLSLRAAEAAARLGQAGLAKDEIQGAYDIAPDNVVILAARAEILRGNAEYAEAAEAFETLASVTQSKARQVDALYQAALIWLDTLGDRGRGMLALQEAAAIDSPHAGLFARLQNLHAQSEDFQGLDQWIEQHARHADQAELGCEFELERALALVQTGHDTEAREILDNLLHEHPEHAEALHTSAEMYFRARHWQDAEHAWRRIVEHSPRDPWYLLALHGLGSLYDGELADPERALIMYGAILVKDPEDQTVRRRSIRVLSALDRTREAISEQRELVLRAGGDDERRHCLLELVQLLEKYPDGHKEAQALLEQAHRTWPESPDVLEAEVEHYRRVGEHGTARVIVERATNAARNAIHAGRLEPSLFRTLQIAAGLGGDADSAQAAQTALGAIQGESQHLGGAGAQAGQPRLDELMAPVPLSAGFLRMLYGAGAAIERAYALDPHLLEPSPAPEALALEVRAIAAGFGLKDVRVLMSEQLGCDCSCLHGPPVSVVFGRRLLEHPDAAVRNFLLLRALKLAQANACAMSLMTARELWSAVAGFLACFAPPVQAEGSDAQRLIAARNRIRPHVTASPEPELIALTSALTANVLPQAAQLGHAIWQWASRVALLGVGPLGSALDALWAVANMGPAMPVQLESRIRWIANSALATDLVSFSVSESYIEARRRAGLTRAAS
jgi:predicted Zn-dependent protease